MDHSNKIRFIESKGDVLVQATDFITGHVLRKYRLSMSKRVLNTKEIEFGEKLLNRLVNYNIVSTKDEQAKFFSDYEIEFE